MHDLIRTATSQKPKYNVPLNRHGTLTLKHFISTRVNTFGTKMGLPSNQCKLQTHIRITTYNPAAVRLYFELANVVSVFFALSVEKLVSSQVVEEDKAGACTYRQNAVAEVK